MVGRIATVQEVYANVSNTIPKNITPLDHLIELDLNMV